MKRGQGKTDYQKNLVGSEEQSLCKLFRGIFKVI